MPNGATSLYFNSPSDLTVPVRRFGAGNASNFTTLATDLTNLSATNSQLVGADIQLTDVVSFDVRVLVMGAPTGVDPFVTLFDLVPPSFLSYATGNPTFTSTMTTSAPLAFDTWSSITDGLNDYSSWYSLNSPTSIPMWNSTAQAGPIIQALQISIRIWDMKTNQTRQVTFIQAM